MFPTDVTATYSRQGHVPAEEVGEMYQEQPVRQPAIVLRQVGRHVSVISASELLRLRLAQRVTTNL